MKFVAIRVLAVIGAILAWLPSTRAEELPTSALRVVGGLAGINQFNNLERPFWTRRIAERSGGRITAEIAPFDQSGIRANEMPRLISQGVVSFGTILLSQMAGEEPRVAAMELAGLNPDIATQRRSVEAFRPVLAEIMREQVGAELLAVYSYPAQVLFCAGRTERLADLAGRRVRTSSVLQADFVEALGATPVIIPFAGIVKAVREKSVDCVVTGSMPGNALGLHNVTTHIYPMPISWGLSAFVVNTQAWNALAPATRTFLKAEIADLEREMWAAATAETADGIACNVGTGGCPVAKRGRLTLANVSREDQARRVELLRSVTLPRWLERCGPDCLGEWNRTVGAALDIRLDAP
jgi:TRAP-type C4-dicarboxylate transport system substrate-binding protein